jgi:hypothetical protein
MTMNKTVAILSFCSALSLAFSDEFVRISGKYEVPNVSYKDLYVFSPAKTGASPGDGRAKISEDGSFNVEVSKNSLNLLSVHDKHYTRGMYFITKEDIKRASIVIDAKSTALGLITIRFEVRKGPKDIYTIFKYPENVSIIENVATHSKCFPVFKDVLEKELQKPTTSNLRLAKANLNEGESCAREISKDPAILAANLVYNSTPTN